MTQEKVRHALVASDSPVAKDPRVLRQIQWLVDAGWIVDTLGRGASPPEANGDHYEMPYRPLPLRVAANILLPHNLKNSYLVETTVPRSLRKPTGRARYELAVVNEIELLPWITRARDRIVAPRPTGRVHLDLHEYAPSQQRGTVHRLIFRRYRLWLVRLIASGAFTSRSAVSPGVAELYSTRLGIPRPSVVRSCPDFVDLVPSPVDPDDIRLVHHGSAASLRGLHLMIDAMHAIEERFSLHLMLVGNRKWIDDLRRQAAPLGSRVVFHEPVDVRSVSTALNSYDLEIIFFPPITENLRYTLPNKLFEAIQGRLGLVIGRSPDMVELTSSYRNAVVAEGWQSGDLADAINRLSLEEVEELKRNSDAAAEVLSARSEGILFVEAVADAR